MATTIGFRAGTNHWTLCPGSCHQPGQKGCQQDAKGLRPFCPGLRLQPGQKILKEPGQKTPYPLAGFKAMWPDHLSQLQTWPGEKARMEGPFLLVFPKERSSGGKFKGLWLIGPYLRQNKSTYNTLCEIIRKRKTFSKVSFSMLS
jgi:hypothetical protein